MKQLINLVGWYGVLAIVTAYTLLTFRVIQLDSAIYPLLNLTGSIAILIEALAKKDYQPVVLNLFWAAVALFALATYYFPYYAPWFGIKD